jgi:hypothetical protein
MSSETVYIREKIIVPEEQTLINLFFTPVLEESRIGSIPSDLSKINVARPG